MRHRGSHTSAISCVFTRLSYGDEDENDLSQVANNFASSKLPRALDGKMFTSSSQGLCDTLLRVRLHPFPDGQKWQRFL